MTSAITEQEVEAAAEAFYRIQSFPHKSRLDPVRAALQAAASVRPADHWSDALHVCEHLLAVYPDTTDPILAQIVEEARQAITAVASVRQALSCDARSIIKAMYDEYSRDEQSDPARIAALLEQLYVTVFERPAVGGREVEEAVERLTQVVADEDRTKKASPRGYRGTTVVAVEDIRTLLDALEAASVRQPRGDALGAVGRLEVTADASERTGSARDGLLAAYGPDPSMHEALARDIRAVLSRAPCGLEKEVDLSPIATALDKLPPRPWKLWTSCSFRRIGGATGRDGDVLSAFNQRSDGHPDLTMPEHQLQALVDLVNRADAIINLSKGTSHD